VSYILDNPGTMLSLLVQHLRLVGEALAVSVAVALPLGTLLARHRWLTVPVLGVLGIVYTIPSLALMILLLPLLGLGGNAVVVALILYVQIVLVRNVVAGLQSVDPSVREAARGMGMSSFQRWWKVELPLALPIILAGVRVAALAAIAIAAIGALFGAGGLGTLLFDGITETNYVMIQAGAIMLAALALAVNWGLVVLERALSRPAKTR
jgi:osmoprotectant transport system permease protein